MVFLRESVGERCGWMLGCVIWGLSLVLPPISAQWTLVGVFQNYANMRTAVMQGREHAEIDVDLPAYPSWVGRIGNASFGICSEGCFGAPVPKRFDELESLILAQSERWRHA